MFRILSLVFAFFVAVLSITVTPLPANGTNIEKRITHTGRVGLVYCIYSLSDHNDINVVSLRELGTTPASALVVKRTLTLMMSSQSVRASMVLEGIVTRYAFCCVKVLLFEFTHRAFLC